MTTSPNFWPVYERLVDDDALPPRAARLVEAAMQGEGRLQAALGDGESEVVERERPAQTPGEAPRTFLRSVTVEGVRGVGPASQLAVEPGPGLTLIVGRNGSGKSSFVEGLELLLTGDSTRWKGKRPVRDWRSGWRNLHHPGRARIEARCTVEGSREAITIARQWSEGAGLDDGEIGVHRGSGPVAGGLQGLGWAQALEAHRPFLSYNDISRAWDGGPSKLFDALMGMLGLDDVREALSRLANLRKALAKRKKSLSTETKALQADLANSEDPRALACAVALKPRTADHHAVEEILSGSGAGESDSVIREWRSLASLRAPERERVDRVIDDLSQAIAERRVATKTQTVHMLATAELLDHAVRWHERVGMGVCPVCGTDGVLDERWRLQAAAQVQELRQASSAEVRVQRRIRDTMDRARGLVTATPVAVGDSQAAVAAREAHAAWAGLPEAAEAVAEHLGRTWQDLNASYAACRALAEVELRGLDADWRPLRSRLEAWLTMHADVASEADDLVAVKQAEAWLKAAEELLRTEAFAPIAEQAKRAWGRLRAQSNVDIEGVTLQGTATHRKVSLDVSVDGTEGVALGVMSQGELHAMALSLFLPRLLRAESPFGFVVIDDPVQAMDPAKVDGLAVVLQDAARTHQVLVFTHDPRLPAAVRRLGIDASVLEVRRNLTSHVDVRIGMDPVQQHISDAMHLYDQRQHLGDDVVRHVVPGLCRSAVEAALLRRIWRERLARGEAHADIVQIVRDARGIHNLATVALLGDRNKGGDLFNRLKRIQPGAVDVFVELKRKVHEPLPPEVDIGTFIRDARALAHGVLA